MTRKLQDIMKDMQQAIMGRKPGHRWTESATDVYEATLGGLKNLSGDTLGKTAQTFNEALPYIERAGFDVTEIEVGMGLDPKIVPHLRLREVIPENEKQILLEQTRSKRLINTILSSLFRASAARSKLSFQRFQFDSLELELSILPTVVLKFRPTSSPNSGTETANALSVPSEKL